MFRYLRQTLPHKGILRRMLLWMTGGIILPLTVLNLIYLNFTYRDLHGQTVQSYQSNSRQVVMNLDNILEGVGLYTSYPYYDDHLQEMLHKDYGSERGRREITRDYRMFQSAILTQVMRYNSSVFGAILYNAGSDASFLGGHPYSSDMQYDLVRSMAHLREKQGYHNETALLSYQGPGEGIPAFYILIARPLFDTGTREYLGFFGLLVELGTLEEVFVQNGAIDGVRQYVVDNSGRIIYAQDTVQVGQPISAVSLGQLYSEAEQGFTIPVGQAEDMDIGGHVTIVTRDTLRSAAWNVVSLIDADILFAPTKQRQQIWILAFILLMGAGILAVSQVSISVSRPIRSLSLKITDVIQSHDFSTPIGIGSRDEVGQLAASFNLLLDEIQCLLIQVVQQEEEKQATEMRALQAQVNPHFLGNTLNTIKWMANMQCAHNISDAVGSLIHLMNYALDSERRFVTVAQELEFTRRYIELMRLRYFGSFDLECRIDDAILDCQTIRFMLQPLVDNAIFHGLQKSTGRNLLRITAEKHGDRLVFHVWDNGVGMEQETIEQVMEGKRKKERGFNSIGVYNVIERIRLHYGAGYGVTITSEVGLQTDVRVAIPALPMPGPEGEGTV